MSTRHPEVPGFWDLYKTPKKAEKPPEKRQFVTCQRGHKHISQARADECDTLVVG